MVTAAKPKRRYSVLDTALALLPVGLGVGLAGVVLLPRVQESVLLMVSFLGAAAFLLFWYLFMGVAARLSGGRRYGVAGLFTLAARPQHYVQAMVQFAVFFYWGWHWRPVYEHLPLLLGQIVFAYAFDMLLAWSRGRPYMLGFGPFPIIFSVNLFLWFRDDWFYLQFLMIAVGFLGKEYIRWMRDGRSVHIFNPSALALGLFSLILIATDTTDLTWGQEIASTLTLAPNIYTFLFLAGLVVMYFFSITLVAGCAAVTLFALSALYASAAGVPYFVDSDIPAAVFLGLHLLVTDPSTSPRSGPGKALFGLLYGLGVFILYTLLEWMGAPTFYDKLLCVPLLNLSVIAIDRVVQSMRWPTLPAAMGMGGAVATGNAAAKVGMVGASSKRANLVHIACWVAVFLLMTALGRTDGRHTGDSLPFWERACAAGLGGYGPPDACARLRVLQAAYCRDNSAWACNELGLHYRRGDTAPADSGAPEQREAPQQRDLAEAYFGRACELRFSAGCLNLLDETGLHAAPPKPLDLRLLLREGGRNLMDIDEAALYARACEHGWTLPAFACAGTDATEVPGGANR